MKLTTYIQFNEMFDELKSTRFSWMFTMWLPPITGMWPLGMVRWCDCVVCRISKIYYLTGNVPFNDLTMGSNNFPFSIVVY